MDAITDKPQLNTESLKIPVAPVKTERLSSRLDEADRQQLQELRQQIPNGPRGVIENLSLLNEDVKQKSLDFNPYVLGLPETHELSRKVSAKDHWLADHLQMLNEARIAVENHQPEAYPGANLRLQNIFTESIRDHIIKKYIRLGLRPPLPSEDMNLTIKQDRIALIKKQEEDQLGREYIHKRDEQIGQTDKLLFHNGSFDNLDAILSSGFLMSHRALLEAGKSFRFTTGANQNNGVSDLILRPDGISYTIKDRAYTDQKFVSYADYKKYDGKIPKDGEIAKKDLFLEFDQVLFSEEEVYYDSGGDSDWAIVLPEREVFAHNQYSLRNDGIHVFDKDYDSDAISPEEESSGLPPGKKGASVDLNQTPFLIAIGDSTRDKFGSWLSINFPHVPDLREGDTIKVWRERHIVDVPTLNKRESHGDYVASVKQAMFSRFDVPLYNGHQEPTGNRGDNAVGHHKIDLFKYQLSD